MDDGLKGIQRGNPGPILGFRLWIFPLGLIFSSISRGKRIYTSLHVHEYELGNGKSGLIREVVYGENSMKYNNHNTTNLFWYWIKKKITVTISLYMICSS